MKKRFLFICLLAIIILGIGIANAYNSCPRCGSLLDGDRQIEYYKFSTACIHGEPGGRDIITQVYERISYCCTNNFCNYCDNEHNLIHQSMECIAP